jgi:hypothetical protein
MPQHGLDGFGDRTHRSLSPVVGLRLWIRQLPPRRNGDADLPPAGPRSTFRDDGRASVRTREPPALVGPRRSTSRITPSVRACSIEHPGAAYAAGFSSTRAASIVSDSCCFFTTSLIRAMYR